MKVDPSVQMTQHSSEFKNRLARLGGEALWIAGGQVVCVGILFAGVRVMTEVMPPAEYGKLAIIMSLVNGSLYSVGQALKLSATRYFPVMANDPVPNWYWGLIRKTIHWAVILFAGAAVLFPFCHVVLGNSWQTGLTGSLAVLLSLVVLVNALSYGVQNGARDRKALVTHQVMFDGLRFFLAFLVAYYLSGSAVGALSGFVLAGILVMVSQLYYLANKKTAYFVKNGDVDPKRAKQFLAYTWPLILGGVLGWIQIFSDRWAIKSLSTYTDVGIYFALYQTVYSIWVYATTMLGNFLGTLLFSRVKDGSDARAHFKMLKINESVTMGFGVLVLMSFLLLIPIKGALCSLLFADTYQSAAELLPWMALSGGIFGMGQQLLYSVYGRMGSYRIIPVKLLSAVVAIGCHFAGAAYWGIKGVVMGGVGFSIFYLMAALAAHLNEIKRVKIKDTAGIS